MNNIIMLRMFLRKAARLLAVIILNYAIIKEVIKKWQK